MPSNQSSTAIFPHDGCLAPQIPRQSFESSDFSDILYTTSDDPGKHEYHTAAPSISTSIQGSETPIHHSIHPEFSAVNGMKSPTGPVLEAQSKYLEEGMLKCSADEGKEISIGKDLSGSNPQSLPDSPQAHSSDQVNPLFVSSQYDDTGKSFQSLPNGQSDSEGSWTPKQHLLSNENLGVDGQQGEAESDESELVTLKFLRHCEANKDEEREGAIIALTEKHIEETSFLKRQLVNTQKLSQKAIRFWQVRHRGTTAKLLLVEKKNDSLRKQNQDLSSDLAGAYDKIDNLSARFTVSEMRRADLEADFNACVTKFLERTQEDNINTTRVEAEEAHKHTIKLYQELRQQDKTTIKTLQRKLDEKVASVTPSELELKCRQQTKDCFKLKQKVWKSQKEMKNLTTERDTHYKNLLQADEDYQVTRRAQIEAQRRLENIQDSFVDNERKTHRYCDILQATVESNNTLCHENHVLLRMVHGLDGSDDLTIRMAEQVEDMVAHDDRNEEIKKRLQEDLEHLDTVVGTRSAIIFSLRKELVELKDKIKVQDQEIEHLAPKAFEYQVLQDENKRLRIMLESSTIHLKKVSKVIQGLKQQIIAIMSNRLDIPRSAKDLTADLAREYQHYRKLYEDTRGDLQNIKDRDWEDQHDMWMTCSYNYEKIRSSRTQGRGERDAQARSRGIEISIVCITD